MDGQVPAGVAGLEGGRRAAGAASAELAGHSCGDDVCITCSDTAVPSRVVELRDPGLALVDTGTSMEVISVALVDARPGDTVLVHAGEAIGVIAQL